MGKLTFGQTGLSYEADKVQIKLDGAPKCPKCDQRVYFNEEKKAFGKSWHTKCFTCNKCRKALASTNYHQLNEEVVCTVCYKKADTMKPASSAYVPGYGVATPSVIPADRFDSERWNETESKRSSGSQDCYVEAERGDLKAGYTETWLNSQSGGSAVSSPSQGSREDLRVDTQKNYSTTRPSEITSLQARSSVNDPTGFLFSQGFTNSEPSSDPYTSQTMPRSAGVLDNPMRKERSERASARLRINSDYSLMDKDNPECCPRCGKRVYFAEEIKAEKRKWHKLCFKCATCSKTLEPGKFTEHDSQLYCQKCYGKNFGPHGYGTIGGVHGPSNNGVPAYYTATSLNQAGSRSSISTPYEVETITRREPYKPGVSELSSEATTLEVRQPIRGTHEWTEAISYYPM